MSRANRLVLCGFVFVVILAIELALVMALPVHVTDQQFQEFLWISFAFIFMPLILLAVLLLALAGLLLWLAFVPARAVWRATSPDNEAPDSVSAQLRKRDEYLRKLRAERARR